MQASERPTINGIDLQSLDRMTDRVKAGGCSASSVRVTTRWKGKTRSESTVESFTCAGEPIARNFTIVADEPHELLGTDTAPNPQELLLSALNACMMVGYVAQCALRGIVLESLEIETQGDIDLRGFLGLDPRVAPGYESLSYTVRIKGDGTPEQFAEIHEAVKATSPNFYNIANAITLKPELVVG